MKYVILLITLAAGYFFLIRQAPVTPVVSAVKQDEAASLSSGPRGGAAPQAGSTAVHSDPIKAPIDRTRAVLDQVKQRNGDGEF